MKNWKLSRKITLGILLIVLVCMSLLYVTANKTMRGMMQESERNHMESTLKGQTGLIEEYVQHQEDMLHMARQTEETAEAMTVIVGRNKENANAISGIVKRFS